MGHTDSSLKNKVDSLESSTLRRSCVDSSKHRYSKGAAPSKGILKSSSGSHSTSGSYNFRDVNARQSPQVSSLPSLVGDTPEAAGVSAYDSLLRENVVGSLQDSDLSKSLVTIKFEDDPADANESWPRKSAPDIMINSVSPSPRRLFATTSTTTMTEADGNRRTSSVLQRHGSGGVSTATMMNSNPSGIPGQDYSARLAMLMRKDQQPVISITKSKPSRAPGSFSDGARSSNHDSAIAAMQERRDLSSTSTTTQKRPSFRTASSSDINAPIMEEDAVFSEVGNCCGKDFLAFRSSKASSEIPEQRSSTDDDSHRHKKESMAQAHLEQVAARLFVEKHESQGLSEQLTAGLKSSTENQITQQTAQSPLQSPSSLFLLDQTLQSNNDRQMSTLDSDSMSTTGDQQLPGSQSFHSPVTDITHLYLEDELYLQQMATCRQVARSAPTGRGLSLSVSCAELDALGGALQLSAAKASVLAAKRHAPGSVGSSTCFSDYPPGAGGSTLINACSFSTGAAGSSLLLHRANEGGYMMIEKRYSSVGSHGFSIGSFSRTSSNVQFEVDALKAGQNLKQGASNNTLPTDYGSCVKNYDESGCTTAEGIPPGCTTAEGITPGCTTAEGITPGCTTAEGITPANVFAHCNTTPFLMHTGAHVNLTSLEHRTASYSLRHEFEGGSVRRLAPLSRQVSGGSNVLLPEPVAYLEVLSHGRQLVTAFDYRQQLLDHYDSSSQEAGAAVHDSLSTDFKTPGMVLH
ncbi:hypothetical protein CEUSTIGMA_g3848.t1 [Chlamydomonas eustigma]|uniref:Uncharacterized protein n=1 Tax=Chlamydomonas eustigma TaxID=1157962 RepID=A0A250WZZ9_9CHLO|nr:hypothetical protein CEUSTIGMA_g3848.t1 [Chlamydomonas eustigma]|eukprot:GAX76403.1 hypothetical protein CEUSTIGMA_g3848.t1 [Chlamydomonas eustigma]